MATVEAIRAVYFEESDGVAHALIHQLADVPPAPIETQFRRLGGAGYSVGLEIGLAVAITVRRAQAAAVAEAALFEAHGLSMDEALIRIRRQPRRRCPCAAHGGST
jgi:hypothetical protein